MKNLVLVLVFLFLGFSLATTSKERRENLSDNGVCFAQTLPKIKISSKPIDSITLSRFFRKYPKLKKYKLEVAALYKKRNYRAIWFDKKGLIEFADLLYSKVSQIESEGLQSNFVYKDKMDAIFNKESAATLSQTDKEIMLSSMYVYYIQKTFHGIDTDKVRETGWLLPRKTISYVSLLDSVLATPQLLDKNEKLVFGQYYKLRDALEKYRQIQKTGDWNPIITDPLVKEYKPGDSSKTIGQIRHRLTMMGDLKQDSGSLVYDPELMAGILNFKRRNGYRPDYPIGSQHLHRMNIPIEDYIKTIMVNMERCRWIPPELAQADAFLIVNIPSFKLLFKKKGQTVLESKVYVGINMLETVIFSSSISRIVFSPYWNVPRSIIENELKPAMALDKNYLDDNEMEWINGNLRQKPGKKNPMGLVKFVFPNSYDIYLHDTPNRRNFDYDFPLFSHGCINMQKAQELAFLILEDDPNWPRERIVAAMNGGQEISYPLKKKIPIHIGYFTAWVNDTGEIHFYFDIYQKDQRLAELLFFDGSD